MYRSARALLTAAALLAASCGSTGPETPRPEDTGVDIEGVVFQNSLAYSVTDALVQVPATGRFASCGNILPRSECSTSFPSVGYRQNGIIVTWKERGKSMGTDEFTVELPQGAARGDSFWLEVVIYAPGLAGARLVQR